MTNWLIRHCITNYQNTTDIHVRSAYGTLSSVTGIIVNCLLAAFKAVTGILSGSLAITADAVNNLSDAGGSIMSLLTVRMAAKPVDKEHPFGHGRMEYIGALGLGFLILLVGLELFKSGINGIMHPTELSASPVVIIILFLSILAKCWLFLFYRKLGQTTDNETLLAASKDSISDVLGTSGVLISTILQGLYGWHIDGYMGVVVACFILRTGIEVCKDTIDRLLGGKPDPKMVGELRLRLLSYPAIRGIHDLVIHDYGPGRCIVTVHAEVDAKGDIIAIHEVIDEAEREIEHAMHVMLCIHMDPVVTDDPQTNHLHNLFSEYLRTVNEKLTLHDFRVVPGEKQTNLIFDVLLPNDYKDGQKLNEKLTAYAASLDPRYHLVVRYDTTFV